MEDSIEVILQDSTSRPHPVLTACTAALLTGLYGVWSLFARPGFRKIPWNLKVLEISLFWIVPACFAFSPLFPIPNAAGLCEGQNITSHRMVPYLPSSKVQTLNIMQLLEGRTGRLADLGSGDGRVVFAASSAGFQCTGFEINSILVACARSKALWAGVPSGQATFVKKDFWKTDLSTYNNVTAFLAPGVMEVLGEKLLEELPDDACVIASRFPFPDWPQILSVGSGLDQTFSYDISSVRSHLRKIPKTVVH